MFWVLLALVFLFYVISWFSFSPFRVKIHIDRISIFYGAPGSGKSSLAAWYADRYLRAGYPVFSNVPIKGCFQIQSSDLGQFQIRHGLLIIDEAGLEYNNRDFASNFNKKSGGSRQLEFFKKHRHEGTEIMVFSQGFDDMDKKIRDLASVLFIVEKFPGSPFVVQRRISKAPDIDELSHKPADFYFFKFLGRRRRYVRNCWHLFDSFDPMDLPTKDFPIYGSVSGNPPSGVSVPCVDQVEPLMSPAPGRGTP